MYPGHRQFDAGYFAAAGHFPTSVAGDLGGKDRDGTGFHKYARAQRLPHESRMRTVATGFHDPHSHTRMDWTLCAQWPSRGRHRCGTQWTGRSYQNRNRQRVNFHRRAPCLPGLRSSPDAGAQGQIRGQCIRLCSSQTRTVERPACADLAFPH